MANFEGKAWLRRDGTPLAISVGLHLLALLLIAPWLVMRTIPDTQVEVEVMLEPEARDAPRNRPAPVARLRNPVKAATPPPRAAQVRPIEAVQETEPRAETPIATAPAAQPNPGESGSSAPAAREVAGLSAPTAPPQQRAAVPLSAGASALQLASRESSQEMPRYPSPGSSPQTSAQVAPMQSRAGVDRENGPFTMDGTAPQAQSVQPEFRQASRQGGQASQRGSSLAPSDSMTREPGSPGQAALFTAPAIPQAQSASGASRGGQAPALAARTDRPSGQGSVAAGEGTASSNLAASTVTPIAGMGAVSASRAAAPSGQSDTGDGSGSRTVSPGERGGGLLAAAIPAIPSMGRGASGSGSGASFAGDGRAQALAGMAITSNDSASPLLAAGGGAAVRAEADSKGGLLSGRADAFATTQALREAFDAPLQLQKPVGQARVIEERFTATAMKVNSPTSICELPLMFAGLDRKPIPKGLDSINATAASLPGETPPRHRPGNQAPRYPLQAVTLRSEGRALVRAEILTDGQVGQIWIKQSSGAQVLDLAALDTVRKWRFFPAQRNGMAVAMWLDVPIEYKLP
ncbi:MAG: TonB family protein [Thiobacillus sp.]